MMAVGAGWVISGGTNSPASTNIREFSFHFLVGPMLTSAISLLGRPRVQDLIGA